MNSPATVKAIGSTIEGYKSNPNQYNLLTMIGIEQASGSVEVQKYVTRIFNRLMMLPVEAQVHFFTKMSEEIGKLTASEGIFSDVSGIGKLNMTLNTLKKLII